MAPSRLPSRCSCLLTCLGAIALFGTDFFWRYKSVQINTPAAIQTAQPTQPTQNISPALAVAPRDNLPPDEAASASFGHLLRTTPPGDPVAMRTIEALAQTPAQAVTVGLRLMQEFPDRSAELGTLLIGALLRTSAHAEALELAQNGPDAQRTEWMTLVLSHWAQNRPADATLIADLLREKGVTSETFEQVATSWAASAPEPLASYALALPPGEYRSIAFQAALEPWILQDPVSVANRLTQLIEPAERDQALALLAARADVTAKTITQTLSWAEAIASPELRRTTLAKVVQEWFAQDPAAASRYLLANPAFDSEQRQSLLASLTPQAEAL